MIEYKEGYEYQLHKDYSLYVGIVPDKIIKSDFLTLTLDGWLTIHKGYAWDGASGAIDTDTIMRGCLVHDALCQLMREGLLPTTYRDKADDVFEEICLEDGMSEARAALDQLGLLLSGGGYVEPENRKPVLTAP